MPIISQIICDGCQAVKKETNHWYTLIINPSEACLRPMATTPVDFFKADAAGVQYLCGRRCVIEALDHWMGRFTAPASQPFHGKANGRVGAH